MTWSLLSNQANIAFPQNRLLELFFFVLPPLGLIVILDGIVSFSYHVLRRDESAPEWVRAMCKTMNNHVVLCGLGKLGLRTLERLLAMGEPVAVLEKDPACPNLAFARRNGVPVRVGHSREEGVFEDLNVAAAKSIILATNDDLANLEMALDARKLHPTIRVVIRMFDQELAAKLRESLGMELTFSTSELAAPLFATCSSDRSVVNSFYVDNRLLIVARLTVNKESELANTPVGQLGQKLHAFVLSHVCGGVSTSIRWLAPCYRPATSSPCRPSRRRSRASTGSTTTQSLIDFANPPRPAGATSFSELGQRRQLRLLGLLLLGRRRRLSLLLLLRLRGGFLLRRLGLLGL